MDGRVGNIENKVNLSPTEAEIRAELGNTSEKKLSLHNLTFLTEKSGKFNFGAITDRPLISRDAVSSIFARIAMGASIDSAGSNSLEKK